MPMHMEQQKNGHIMPVVKGDLCSACGHEIPGSANVPPELHYEPGTAGRLAQHRPDIWYFFTNDRHPETGAKVRRPQVTLYTLEGAPPHCVELVGRMLQDMGRSEEGRAFLAQYGIGVASTHDNDPGVGHELPPEQALHLWLRNVGPKVHPLQEEHVATLKEQQARVAALQQELAEAQAALGQTLAEASPVDLGRHDVHVNLEQGLLVYQPHLPDYRQTPVQQKTPGLPAPDQESR